MARHKRRRADSHTKDGATARPRVKSRTRTREDDDEAGDADEDEAGDIEEDVVVVLVVVSSLSSSSLPLVGSTCGGAGWWVMGRMVVVVRPMAMPLVRRPATAVCSEGNDADADEDEDDGFHTPEPSVITRKSWAAVVEVGIVVGVGIRLKWWIEG